MYIQVSDEVKRLSDIFEKNGETLYVVGGFIRDKILGINTDIFNDIDLSSACKPNKVVKMLKDTEFEIDDSNAKLGMIAIKGKKRYEHTTFRRENYNLNGEHNPTGIEFIKDINEDARRRDFTINAVYYNTSTGDIVDPVGGVADIQRRLIRTPINSDDSFMEDSERILRMIRIACSLSFEIEEKTLVSAVNCCEGVSNLNKHRIRKELEKMLYADQTYWGMKESKYAHAKCAILIGKLNLWQYILPAIAHIQESNLLDNKGEDLYVHLINTFSVCEPEVRLACLMHDVGKQYTKETNNTFEFSSEWADIIIENNLGVDGLYYSKKIIDETKRIVKAIDFDNHGIVSRRKVREFIRENIDIFDKVCMLKDAIALENTNFTQKSKIARRWKNINIKMQKLKTPLTLAELDLNGNDIIEAVPEIQINKLGELLKNSLDFCLHHPRCNMKDILIERVKKIVLKNPTYYFE